jgi:catechol 2,3-dioxygenase-like lactoylglutathione lyase family enzyme
MMLAPSARFKEAAMKSIVTFLLTTDPDAALKFYRDVLGLKFIRDDGFALIFDSNGVMLRIGKTDAFTPAPNTVLGWESDDIESATRDLVQKGVVFQRYPNMQQDTQGIQTFPGGDKVAWFKDPDGNVLSISQHASVLAG